MKLYDLAAVSQSVSSTSGRLDKVQRLAGCLRVLAGEEVEIAVRFLSGSLRQGRIGMGYANLRGAIAERGTAKEPALTLLEVDSLLSQIAGTTGAGSAAKRRQLLGNLLGRATPFEQDWLVRLMLGELRQGALEGVMLEAIARAASVPLASVRRSAMFAGELPQVARVALEQGASALDQFTIQLMRPVQPMLAQTADSVGEALGRLQRGALEFKLDGARIQVHKQDEQVRVFTRRLNDVTAAIPEVVEQVRSLPARQLILDGEVLALRADGTPHPFQTTMRRFGRKLDVGPMRVSLPLTPYFFDCLYHDGVPLIDRPAHERFAAMDLLPSGLVIPRQVTSSARDAQAYLQEAIRRGHEGIMVKSLEAVYDAGSRGQNWLKVKPAHTLDLVVLAAEWGHGRRHGYLSNLHLGARDPSSGGYAMIGKTFKGLTDELLQWQTRRLQQLETSRDGITVYVRPQLVVEIAFNEIQASPHYASGMALRFARVKRYRGDKRPEEADTIDTVRRLLQRKMT